MGSLIAESSAVSTQAEEFFVETDLKDSKKKKRRARKSKQNPSGNRIFSLVLRSLQDSAINSSKL